MHIFATEKLNRRCSVVGSVAGPPQPTTFHWLAPSAWAVSTQPRALAPVQRDNRPSMTPSFDMFALPRSCRSTSSAVSTTTRPRRAMLKAQRGCRGDAPAYRCVPPTRVRVSTALLCYLPWLPRPFVDMYGEGCGSRQWGNLGLLSRFVGVRAADRTRRVKRCRRQRTTVTMTTSAAGVDLASVCARC